MAGNKVSIKFGIKIPINDDGNIATEMLLNNNNFKIDAVGVRLIYKPNGEEIIYLVKSADTNIQVKNDNGNWTIQSNSIYVYQCDKQGYYDKNNPLDSNLVHKLLQKQPDYIEILTSEFVEDSENTIISDSLNKASNVIVQIGNINSSGSNTYVR